VLTIAGYLGAVVLGFGPILAGMNVAIIYRFWPEPWLVTKLVAVTGLITYLLFSIVFGGITAWLAAFGLVAVLGDIWAIKVLSTALRSARVGDGILIAYRRR
jgi:uncharacterized membrane protein YjjB (DUF3815 family)